MTETLSAYQDWLEKTELPKMKEAFRIFHTAFFSLYSLFLKRKLIREDPYKQEAKIVDVTVPDTGPLNEADRLDELSQRLSQFDNQLDFLVNFYQFSLENMGLERIKRIVGLVKYIDWIRFSPDISATPLTRAVVDMLNQAKAGSDQFTMTLIADALNNLSKASAGIMKGLKGVSDYNREAYKLELRIKIIAALPPGDAAQVAQIKKRFAGAIPGKPFYPELAEEVIREDYSKEGSVLREKILKLFAGMGEQPKSEKAAASFKGVLIEGLFIMGSLAPILIEILPKMEENHALLQNQKANFWNKVRELMQQVMKKDPDTVVYEVEYMDNNRGLPIHEQINYSQFREDMERKAKTLAGINARSGVGAKLEAMDEAQLEGFLERYIRETQAMHKSLTALDEYFKNTVDKDSRNKIKGIKPELGAMKNVVVKANQKRYEYSAHKEEQEQLKQLGVAARA